MFLLQAPGLPFSCPVCSRRSAVSLSFTTVSSLIMDRSIWKEKDCKYKPCVPPSSVKTEPELICVAYNSLFYLEVEVSGEGHTNLPYSFWTWHLNPLPSCFLLKCQQHVLFFQQHIPEIEPECHSQWTNLHIV